MKYKNLGDESAASHFKLLQEAKNVLLDPQTRKFYDQWLYSGIQIPFPRWLNLARSGNASLHWSSPRVTMPMIHSSDMDGAADWSPRWQSDSSDEILRRFRNYEI